MTEREGERESSGQHDNMMSSAFHAINGTFTIKKDSHFSHSAPLCQLGVDLREIVWASETPHTAHARTLVLLSA